MAGEPFNKEILALAANIIALAQENKILLATAESCTGGLVSGALTEIPGASDCLLAGFVTYDNIIKSRVLGVDIAMIEDQGAVSEDVARAMAAGAVKAASATISVAITGIAGPRGGSPEKPVGTVHFATARREAGRIETHHERHYIKAQGRSAIRLEAVRIALSLLLREIQVLGAD